MEKLFLVTNPGSSSRKYGLYKGDDEVCSLHFEMEGNDVVCTIKKDGVKQKLDKKFAIFSMTKAISAPLPSSMPSWLALPLLALISPKTIS